MSLFKEIWYLLKFNLVESSNFPTDEGAFGYDNTTKSHAGRNNISGSLLNYGREIWAARQVKNTTGVVIPDGTPVKYVGMDGNYVLVSPAAATSLSNAQIYGITTSPIPNNDIGEVTVRGALNNLDTSSFSPGDVLYLSETPGEMTKIKPKILVELGRVLVSDATVGVIEVLPSFFLSNRTNVIYVRGLPDLPDPVLGEITLNSDTIYEFIGTVNIGANTLILSDGTILRGADSKVDGVEYTGTGYVISSVDTLNNNVNNMWFSAPSGKIFETRNTAGNEGTATYFIQNVIVRDCDYLGDIENIKRFWCTTCEVQSTTSNGIQCSGSLNGDFIVYDCRIDNFTGTLINLNSSVWITINISRNHIVHSSGNTVLSGLVNSGNLNTTSGFGILSLNNFTGDGTPLNNITRIDTRWKIFPNAGVPDGVPLPARYIGNAGLTYVSASQIQIGSSGILSEVKDDLNIFDIRWIGALTVDITISGAGGLDTGTEANDTWYAVYVLADSNGTNNPVGLMSTSASAPTLPAGYNLKRRLGWVRNNSSGNFLNFLQTGSQNEKLYTYQENIVQRIIISGGTSTTWSTLSAATFVPPTARRMNAYTLLSTDTATDLAFIRTTGSGLTSTGWVNKPGRSTALSNSSGTPLDNIITDTNQNIDYIVSAGCSIDIYMVSYFDEI